jgi:uncharacterized membrane protein
MQQPRNLNVRWEWIGQGWEMINKQLGNWILITLVAGVIYFISQLPFYIFGGLLEFASTRSNSDNGLSALVIGSSVIARILEIVAGWVALALIYSGMYSAALKQMRGGEISVGDLFSGTQYYVQALIATVLIGIATLIGFLLCIVPGFLVMGLVFFTYPLIVDRKLGAVDAIKASIDVTQQNLFSFTLFAFVVGLMAGLGVIVCCVGILITFPLFIATVTCAYRDCFGIDGMASNESYTPPPPPNYGGYEPPPPPPSSWQ